MAPYVFLLVMTGLALWLVWPPPRKKDEPEEEKSADEKASGAGPTTISLDLHVRLRTQGGSAAEPKTTNRGT